MASTPTQDAALNNGNSNDVEEPRVLEEDWGLPLDFNLFAQHERHKVYFYHTDQDNDDDNEKTETKNDAHQLKSDRRTDSSSLDPRTFFWLEYVEELTPLDMMQLSSGVHDATGNCVWTGAYLFLAALSSFEFYNAYIHGKSIFELGSGTGLAGLACLLRPSTWTTEATAINRALSCDDGPEAISSDRDALNRRTAATMKTRVCFTDSDPAALDLCQRNCHHNQISEDQYQISQHMWGSSSSPSSFLESLCSSKENTTKSSLSWSCFDTVIAADILYDIAMLGPIFQSARHALLAGKEHHSDPHDGDVDEDNKDNHQSETVVLGHFLLSHVPRACYTKENPPSQSSAADQQNGTTKTNNNNSNQNKEAQRNQLEERIVQQGTQNYGFELMRQVSPLEFQSSSTHHHDSSRNLHSSSLEEMALVGATLFIFQLSRPSVVTQSGQ